VEIVVEEVVIDNHRIFLSDDEYYEALGKFWGQMNVGTLVWDDLTRSNSTIIEVLHDELSLTDGIRLDNDYCDGLRFPWEVGFPRTENGEEIILEA
jgi:hypothetical protein